MSQHTNVDPNAAGEGLGGRMASLKRVFSRTFTNRRSSKAGSEAASGVNEEHWGAYMDRYGFGKGGGRGVEGGIGYKGRGCVCVCV